MTVTHLKPTANFEECLQYGGVHMFYLTSDEIPELDGELQPLSPHGLQLSCKEIPLKSAGEWTEISKTLAQRNAYCVYRRSGTTSYEVTCVIPPPPLVSDTPAFKK